MRHNAYFSICQCSLLRIHKSTNCSHERHNAKHQTCPQPAMLHFKRNSARHQASCTLWADLSTTTVRYAQALLTFGDRARKKLMAGTHVKRKYYQPWRGSITKVLSRSLLLCVHVALAVEDSRRDRRHWHTVTVRQAASRWEKLLQTADGNANVLGRCLR